MVDELCRFFFKEEGKEAKEKGKTRSLARSIDRTNRARVLLNFEKESSVRPHPTHSRPSAMVFAKGSFISFRIPPPTTAVNHLPLQAGILQRRFKKKKHSLQLRAGPSKTRFRHLSYPPPTTGNHSECRDFTRILHVFTETVRHPKNLAKLIIQTGLLHTLPLLKFRSNVEIVRIIRTATS